MITAPGKPDLEKIPDPSEMRVYITANPSARLLRRRISVINFPSTHRLPPQKFFSEFTAH